MTVESIITVMAFNHVFFGGILFGTIDLIRLQASGPWLPGGGSPAGGAAGERD